MNYKKLFSSFVFSFVLIISFFSVVGVAKADTWPLVGWGWSSTLGHISFSCNNTAECPQSTYGVNLDSYTGELSGYAWSSTVGWIKFEGDATHPTPRVTDWGTGKMVGWARACVGTANGLCTGAARTDGWDGWIKLSDDDAGVNSKFPSPTLDGSRGITFKAGGTFAGYAWGDVNMGWMTFGNVRSSTNTQLPTVTLTASPTSVESGGNTTLTWKPENANACTATNTNDATQNTSGISWTGAKSFSNGTYTEARTSLTGTFPKTYNITCSNQFGTATSTVRVSLTSPSVSPSSPPGSPTFTLSHDCSPLNTVNLNWSSISGASTYQVVRSDTGSSMQYNTRGSVTAPVRNYSDSGGLSNGVTYWYKVYVKNSSGTTIYTYGPKSVQATSCVVSGNTTALKMWIDSAPVGTSDTQDTHYKTIKAGQDFTIRWDEIVTDNVIDYASCDVYEVSKTGARFLDGNLLTNRFYTMQSAQVGTYKYTITCDDRQTSPTTFTAKVYNQADNVVISNITGQPITELTIVVKSSKINEQ